MKCLFVAALALPFLVVTGCSDDTTPAVDDSGVDADPFRRDTGDTPRPDGPGKTDTYVWPDTQFAQDQWVWPEAGYGTSPFGCQVDTDCFGRKCCATPWGVKVCADTCTN